MNVSFKSAILITGNSPKEVDEAVKRKINEDKTVIYTKYSSCVEDGAIVLTKKDIAGFLKSLGNKKLAKWVTKQFDNKKPENVKNLRIQNQHLANVDLAQSPRYAKYNDKLNEYFLKCEDAGKDASGEPVIYEKA